MLSRRVVTIAIITGGHSSPLFRKGDKMKKLKKIILFIIVSCMILTSCNSNSEQTTQETIATYEHVYETRKISTNDNYFSDLDFEMETDYSNIVIMTEFDTYDKDVEQIQVTIQNNNPGKAFLFFSGVFLEKKVDDEWVKLNYKYIVKNEMYWALCEVENSPDLQFATRLSINCNDLASELTPGTYRAVGIAGETIVYDEFEIE